MSIFKPDRIDWDGGRWLVNVGFRGKHYFAEFVTPEAASKWKKERQYQLLHFRKFWVRLDRPHMKLMEAFLEADAEWWRDKPHFTRERIAILDLCHHFGGYYVDGLTTAEVADFDQALRSDGWADSRIHLTLKVLAMVIHLAAVQKWLAGVPLVINPRTGRPFMLFLERQIANETRDDDLPEDRPPPLPEHVDAIRTLDEASRDAAAEPG